ncbi:DNA mismatch repair protein MLH3-like isoform X1 [Arachis hypogaea]|uniref:MutL C-terminal dimerisation domain-containing protein n=2 Tax=Arachis hypogaea TaxID=3818 RepID=A0A444WV15_ARAHY|nr:DNA mismatch repair protein MLH3-like isoform X1 [Arachis hypogaea]XP_025698218.1 DNA mismatch repair protein MLH3-like isoform X1 [Arachis hypogaea]QHO40277.1 DNA mismatch repair protein [Arachis hypogaea]RYQ81235.1 hypothetical protein Ahy_Scaffold1g107218 [Arachis hypogaea]
MAAPSIRPLPEAVRSSVRSGIFLFDSTRVVEELVFNSLDAGATKVSVFVSIGSCYVKVVDDGGGIARDGLELVGERYATSKLRNLDDLNATSGNFGFRGEALASISEVSLLEIVTRTYGRPNGYRKVLKGCKCLYLGVDDDRKEVGTTVAVRDLFYNQPVRRKYMQSSPNKVLQSIKKCVQRLALVRPNVSFKVIDVERDDELFCTQIASSPLALLTSGFGEEVSSFLQALEVENDIIKLSGYVSGPCNALNMKALQYVYVNSQFVSSGPIHKLLSQLANRFEHLNSWNTNNEFENKKKSRSQPCPAYILNISCPRSFYDLTFEPSKTWVQFKDWDSILNFIEKVIKECWEENLDCGESFNQSTYMVHGDQPWEDLNILSTEADKSRFGSHTKNSQELSVSTSGKLTKDEYHQSDREDVRTSLGYLCQGTEILREKQNKRDFSYQTLFSGNLVDDSYARCMPTVGKHKSLLMYDKNGQSLGDYFSDDNVPSAEILFDNVPFDAPSSSKGRKSCAVGADMINESFEDCLLNDSHGFCNNVEVNEDFQKPFLKSCSIKGSILREKAFFINDEHELHTDGFWRKQTREDCDSLKDYGAQRCSNVKKLKLSRDCDFFSRAVAEDLPYSYYSAAQTMNSGTVDQLFTSEWHSVYQEASSPASAWGGDHAADINDLGLHRTILTDEEENDCDFVYDISRNAKRNVFEFTDAIDSEMIFDTEVDWPDRGHKYSTKKRPDVLFEESECLLPDTCVEKCKSHDKNKSRMDHLRHPALDKNNERSKRSSSAPPFHKRKRRFVSLNQPSEMIAKRPTGQASNPAFNHPSGMIAKRLTGQASNPAFNHREASDFIYAQQSSGALHPSTEDHFLQEFKSNVKQRSDALGDAHCNDNKEIDGFDSFNIQNNAPLRELFSREAQDSIDQGIKWRTCSPEIPKNNKVVEVQSQNNILDISSGFLHLAGDSLIPEAISKKCLEDAKVLHQVDKKFIPVVAGGTLAVIDQHAADERIRLEELRQKVLSGEAKGITHLDAEQELVLPEIGYQLLHSYNEQIKDWGWMCNIHVHSEPYKRNLDVLNRQPMAVTLIAVPCILGVNLNDVDLLEFLQQLADTDGSSTMPPSVIRVLNLKACRGAIMFGDSLLPSECSLIVEELKHTSLCFQCAHGRPTTVPLVNLEALHNQIAKLGQMNGCSNDKFHGLQRHKVCVERTAERLSSARGT